MSDKILLFRGEVEDKKNLFEKLGFSINDIGNEVEYELEIPEGWSFANTLDPNLRILYDDSGNKRGQYEYRVFSRYEDGTPNFRLSFLDLFTYYDVCSVCEYGRYVYFFGNKEERLFVAGDIDDTELNNLARNRYTGGYTKEEADKKLIKLISEHDKESVRLKAICKAYGDEMYPDWNKPDAYWPSKYDKVKKRGDK